MTLLPFWGEDRANVGPEVVFKIKVRKGAQKYSAICWFKVYGFWKNKGDFFYKPMGLIEHKDSYGKWKESLTPHYLNMVREAFVEGRTSSHKRTMTVPWVELCEEMVKRGKGKGNW